MKNYFYFRRVSLAILADCHFNMTAHFLKQISILLIGSAVLQQSCHVISEEPPVGTITVFDECIDSGNSSSFEIVTLNLEGFPKEGNKTIESVRDLIKRINPDIIALQEISSETEFNNLLIELEGWDGRFCPELNDIWNLAYLFKTSEVEIDDLRSQAILKDDFYAFPRAPFEIYVRHKTLDIGTYLINIHLKCCNGRENEARRRTASEKLDNYIKTTRSSDPVIILGDFNDVITGDSSSSNVFYNLVSAPSEYLFTDMNIATGSDNWWSYPSYPGHLDHIVVTHELFSRVDTTMTLRPDFCYKDYFTEISDHRPLELILN